MNILFTLPRAFFPHFTSGADVANFEYLAALARRGARVRVLGLAPVDRAAPLHYSVEGLEVGLLRDAVSLLTETSIVLQQSRPDVFLTGCAGFRGNHDFERILLEMVHGAHVAAALLVRDLEETFQVYEALFKQFEILIANSRFIARCLEERTGRVAEVVYSVPRRARCCFAEGSHAGGYLTMFNPIQPKGIKTLLTLASFHLKHKRFMVVEGWLPMASLGIRVELFKNVTFVPRTHDVSEIYRYTDCLLVPSICPEGFGRVVLEGMFNGLPVAASAVGGIPEIMPDSPLLISDYQSAEAWATALGLLEDPKAFGEVCAYSRERSLFFDHEEQMEHLWQVLQGAKMDRAQAG